MKNFRFRILSFIKYLLRASHKGGYGIHSPFAFYFITNVIEEKCHYYCYKKIESERKRLMMNLNYISIRDFGTGKDRIESISSIARKSVKRKKYAQLIFRIANYVNPNIIIELGTSLGLTTSYLASANTNVPCYTFEGSESILSVAKSIVANCNLSNVNFCNGNINNTLPLVLEKLDSVGLVFFDANHTKEATLHYYSLCKEKINFDSVFIIDDIHSSTEMEEAWNYIKNDEQVRVTIDLYSLGVVFFKEQLQKQDYICFF